MNDALRAAVLADLRPVQPLAPPVRRALAMMPIALVLLLAAPAAFELRDLTALGWAWSWGASIVQMVGGVAVVVLALRDAVPGRAWPPLRILAAAALTILLFVAVTAATWSLSPVPLTSHAWQIGAMCAVGSAVSSLPAVVLGAVLIVRAFPLRPLVSGAIAGLGAGLLADAGWRLFCHFSEPGHVVAAHLGGVALASAAGAAVTAWLARAR